MTAAGFEPMAHGWSLHPAITRRAYRSTRRVGSTKRERSLSRDAAAKGWNVYVAITPCGRFAKVGFSGHPIARVNNGVRLDARKYGWGDPFVVRLYEGGIELERDCLRFMEPDRVTGAPSREWFHVGPRFRVLLNQLDRAERRLP